MTDVLLKRTFHCVEQDCRASEAFIILVDPLASPYEDDQTMRLLATSCGWQIDHNEDEAWCPRHRSGEMVGL
jgi:hypothetical protein